MVRRDVSIASGLVEFVQESRFLLRSPQGTARHFVLHRNARQDPQVLRALQQSGFEVRVRSERDATRSADLALDVRAARNARGSVRGGRAVKRARLQEEPDGTKAQT
jgi:G:T-mismatch repair DNA endonuclease (very short patch repair protein)